MDILLSNCSKDEREDFMISSRIRGNKAQPFLFRSFLLLWSVRSQDGGGQRPLVLRRRGGQRDQGLHHRAGDTPSAGPGVRDGGGITTHKLHD